MIKIAVFVEGLTELEFLSKLLKEIAGQRRLQIDVGQQFQGSLQVHISTLNPANPIDWHVLIANCQNDEQVKTQIVDNYASLAAAGYAHIIGIRDAYPFTHADLPLLSVNLRTALPQGIVPIDIHLAIMETESWFLEEHSHFSRIDNRLTDAAIKAAGFDFGTTRAEDVPNPAALLHEIYQTVGKAYKKTRRQIQRTVEAIDYRSLEKDVRQRSPSFASLLGSLEAALKLP